MENYDIEFDITSILNEILYRGGAQSSTNTPSANERSDRHANSSMSDISGTWISMMHTSQSIMDNLIYSYNRQMERYNQNMERYNQNMERMIQLLLSSQNQIHQYMNPVNTNSNSNSNLYTASTINSQRRNALRNEGNLIRLLLNTSHYGTNRNTANMLYTYLYPNLQNRATTRELSTPVQRANAIQTITYHSSNMRSAIENICPISLLSFQEGEQVSQIKHCMHIFKTEYLNNWLTNYSTCCPVCRYDIRSYQVAQNNHTTNHASNEESETDESESND